MDQMIHNNSGKALCCINGWDGYLVMLEGGPKNVVATALNLN